MHGNAAESPEKVPNNPAPRFRAAKKPRFVKAALARTRMEQLTPKTITTAAAFKAELRRIRTAGYAIDDEEQYLGLRCIAMPVLCYTRQVFATMCVLGPKHRMTRQKLLAVRAPLTTLSERLSQRLGYAPGRRE